MIVANEANGVKRLLSVTQVLLHYLELVTLRVGFYNGSDKFIPLDLEYIAKKAGINFIRAKRAIADLAKAGYIKITRQFDKKEDGTFNGLPSIREISIQFFIDLGIDMQKLFFAREWKRKKREKERAKKTHKKLKGMLKAVTAFGGKRSFSKKVIRRDNLICNRCKVKISLTQHLSFIKQILSASPSEYFKELQRLKE